MLVIPLLVSNHGDEWWATVKPLGHLQECKINQWVEVEVTTMSCCLLPWSCMPWFPPVAMTMAQPWRKMLLCSLQNHTIDLDSSIMPYCCSSLCPGYSCPPRYQMIKIQSYAVSSQPSNHDLQLKWCILNLGGRSCFFVHYKIVNWPGFKHHAILLFESLSRQQSPSMLSNDKNPVVCCPKSTKQPWSSIKVMHPLRISLPQFRRQGKLTPECISSWMVLASSLARMSSAQALA